MPQNIPNGVRAATVKEYVDWLEVFIANGGEIGGIYLHDIDTNPDLLPSRYFATKDTVLAVPFNKGLTSSLIVPKGVKIGLDIQNGNTIGDIVTYLMDDGSRRVNGQDKGSPTAYINHIEELVRRGHKAEDFLSERAFQLVSEHWEAQATQRRAVQNKGNLRRATVEEYVDWLEVFIANGGEIGGIYHYPAGENPELLPSHYIATKDMVLELPVNSGLTTSVIVPQGMTVDVAADAQGDYRIYRQADSSVQYNGQPSDREYIHSNHLQALVRRGHQADEVLSEGSLRAFVQEEIWQSVANTLNSDTFNRALGFTNVQEKERADTILMMPKTVVERALEVVTDPDFEKTLLAALGYGKAHVPNAAVTSIIQEKMHNFTELLKDNVERGKQVTDPTEDFCREMKVLGSIGRQGGSRGDAPSGVAAGYSWADRCSPEVRAIAQKGSSRD